MKFTIILLSCFLLVGCSDEVLENRVDTLKELSHTHSDYIASAYIPADIHQNKSWFKLRKEDIKDSHAGETRVNYNYNSYHDYGMTTIYTTKWIPTDHIVYHNQPLEDIKRAVEKKYGGQK